jgi:hypothetical protein
MLIKSMSPFARWSLLVLLCLALSLYSTLSFRCFMILGNMAAFSGFMIVFYIVIIPSFIAFPWFKAKTMVQLSKLENEIPVFIGGYLSVFILELCFWGFAYCDTHVSALVPF